MRFLVVEYQNPLFSHSAIYLTLPVKNIYTQKSSLLNKVLITSTLKQWHYDCKPYCIP